MNIEANKMNRTVLAILNNRRIKKMKEKYLYLDGLLLTMKMRTITFHSHHLRSKRYLKNKIRWIYCRKNCRDSSRKDTVRMNINGK